MPQTKMKETCNNVNVHRLPHMEERQQRKVGYLKKFLRVIAPPFILYDIQTCCCSVKHLGFAEKTYRLRFTEKKKRSEGEKTLGLSNLFSVSLQHLLTNSSHNGG